jgi:fused signal recognition particle receptor
MKLFKFGFANKKAKEAQADEAAEKSGEEAGPQYGNGGTEPSGGETAEPGDTILEPEPPERVAAPEKEKGLFQSLWDGLSKTRRNLAESLESVFKRSVKIDETLYEELEEALIAADMGASTSRGLIERLRVRVREDGISDAGDVRAVLVDEITSILNSGGGEFKIVSPSVALMIGVNGAGKTTTIGKLAAKYKAEGLSVILAAADTFRAAAIDQLEIWSQRAGVSLVKHQENSDPSAVVFDAIKAAKARKADLLICDTAGRLHNKKNLMEELRKMFKIIGREYPEASLNVFLALDATTGQNALRQAAVFQEICEITGVALTKLDGTAKGGIVVAIKNELNIPVRFVGVGESIGDLRDFDPKAFAEALFGVGGASGQK